MAWLGTSLKIVGQIWGLNFGKEGGWTPIIRSVIFDISLELFQGMYHFSIRYINRVDHTLAMVFFFGFKEIIGGRVEEGILTLNF